MLGFLFFVVIWVLFWIIVGFSLAVAKFLIFWLNTKGTVEVTDTDD